ncbi:MAG: SRPBCC family protein [Marinicella sp.]
MSKIHVEPLIITRNFEYPMQVVYEAWTQEKHLSQWQAPNENIAIEYKFADIKVGGSSLHKMVMPNGNEMWLLTKYQDLQPHHTIVFTQYGSNENGHIISAQMPNWPKEIRVTIKLSESKGITQMEFIWQPINPSKEEAQGWEASRSQPAKGWNGSFELLEGYLSNL